VRDAPQNSLLAVMGRAVAVTCEAVTILLNILVSEAFDFILSGVFCLITGNIIISIDRPGEEI